jgi:hypothetical protein
LYSLPSIIQMISQGRWDRQGCSTHGEKKNAYRVSVGKSQGKRPLGRPRHR